MNDTAPADEATTRAAFADGILELTLSYPRRRNALAPGLRMALMEHLENGLADPACDIVVASRAAVFTCSFNKIGLVPDLGAAWTLPRRIGLGPTKIMMFRGNPVPAEEAARLGLVDALAEPGAALAEARVIARDIAAAAPLSNGMAKQLINRSNGPLSEFLKAEADAQGLLYQSEDFREGRDAFLAKRKPVFTGR